MDNMKEPTAEQRIAARDMFGLFNAMRLEGFTEDQAIAMMGAMLIGVSASGKTDPDA